MVMPLMERDTDRQPTGPSGTLIERVGDHVAAANKVIQSSREAVIQAASQLQQSNGRVQRTYQRLHDPARTTHRSTAAEQRVLHAKQRELAAHDRAIMRHDEAAELQERYGHPDRAANARTNAQHARELREQALHELQDWQRCRRRRGPTSSRVG